ncbi:MAG: ribosome biogenesis GTPase YlqF [Syntrophomonadaceae bacterium]|nr:ribosome biogenesis GTPase YlqF [Syntrophomonadaceae bacterium]
MSINWFPGHMVKARREIEENIKLVDIVVMLLDARAPISCRNPELEKMVARKKVFLVLNKMDLADRNALRKHIASLRAEGFAVAAMDSISGKGKREVLQGISESYQSFADAMLQKGRRVRPARVMVVGVPNIGKSTFLNSLVGRKMAATGAKPGVTRGKQWLRVREDIEFMDTPGLMWPKVGSEEQGYKLALLDIVGDKAYSEYDVALYLVNWFIINQPAILADKFKLNDENMPAEQVMESIARHRGYLLKGGVPDMDKTCKLLLQDFRKGKLGPVSLD